MRVGILVGCRETVDEPGFPECGRRRERRQAVEVSSDDRRPFRIELLTDGFDLRGVPGFRVVHGVHDCPDPGATSDDERREVNVDHGHACTLHVARSGVEAEEPLVGRRERDFSERDSRRKREPFGRETAVVSSRVEVWVGTLEPRPQEALGMKRGLLQKEDIGLGCRNRVENLVAAAVAPVEIIGGDAYRLRSSLRRGETVNEER